MAERKGDMEQGDDRGTKAEHGIGREEAEGLNLDRLLDNP